MSPGPGRAGGGLLELPAPIAARFTARQVLGQGGFGRVLLCHDAGLGREVAVKLLLVASETARRRLRREAELTSRLDHPAVVAVYDQGEHAGECWIVYEHLPGPDLARRCLEPFTTGQLLRWGRGLAEALAAVHRAGIVHRDVKPANLLLRSEDQAVLADFGLGLDPAAARLTETGSVVGTPAYLAPELWMGEPYGPGTDQWALAASLFELHTGTRLQEVSGLRAGDGSIPGGTPPVLPRGRPVRAPGLEAVLLRALDPDPGRRFPDLDALAAALAGLEGDGEAHPADQGTAVPAESPRAPRVGPGPGPPGPRRGTLAQAGLFALALAVALAATAWATAPPPPGSAAPDPPPAGPVPPEAAVGPGQLPGLEALFAGHGALEPGRGPASLVHARRLLPWLMDPRFPLRLGRVLEALEDQLRAASRGEGAGPSPLPGGTLHHVLQDVWQMQRLLDSPWNLLDATAGTPGTPGPGFPAPAIKEQLQAISGRVAALVERWLGRAPGLDQASLALLSELAAVLRLPPGRTLLDEIARRAAAGIRIDPAGPLGVAEWDLVRLGLDYENVVSCDQRLRLARRYAAEAGGAGAPVLAARILEVADASLVLCPGTATAEVAGWVEGAIADLEAVPSWAPHPAAREVFDAVGNLARRLELDPDAWGARGTGLRRRLLGLAASRPAPPEGAGPHG